MELALILPVFLLVVLGMIDFGRGFIMGIAVQNGAREAARYASGWALYSAMDDIRIRQRLIDSSFPALLGCAAASGTCTDVYGATWTITTTPTSTARDIGGTRVSGEQIRVTAAGRLPLLTGVLRIGEIELQGDAAFVII